MVPAVASGRPAPGPVAAAGRGPDRVTAVVLDMGGVLIPEIESYDGVAQDAGLLDFLRARGHAHPEVLVREAGRRVRQAYRERAASCTQPDLHAVLGDLAPDVRAALLRAMARQAAQPPWSFARALVAALARQYRLGLVSNTVIPGDHHERNLGRAGILRHLGAALWSANFGRRKPDPAMLERVLEILRVPPRRALFVGDKHRTDVEAAARAGVRCVWLRTGEPPSGGGARPDFVLSDLRELPALLRRL